MNKAYLYLAVAVVSEVAATTSLKESRGFTRLFPSLIVIAGYGLSFCLLSQTLKFLPVGVVYAIWAGAGIVLTAVLGLILFNQRLDRPAVAGMILIVLGVLVINLFSTSTAGE
jgi:small multidrug resistance pump